MLLTQTIHQDYQYIGTFNLIALAGTCIFKSHQKTMLYRMSIHDYQFILVIDVLNFKPVDSLIIAK